MLSRRDLVGKLAAGAAGAVLLKTASKPANAALTRADERPEGGQAAPCNLTAGDALVEERSPAAAQPPAIPPAPPPWELFQPFTQGAEITHGWYLADLSGPADGACVLTLRNERGRLQRVHLCRNDGRPQGVVYTDRLDLIVMNGGRGDLGTEEHLAQAVAEIAHVLAANETLGHAALAELLPHAERLQQFATANEWSLR